MTAAVSYRRVSTEEQGSSGLGLDAQTSAITAELDRRGWTLEADYCEVASGRSMTRRPELAEAVEHTRRIGGVLVASRIDRISRSTIDVLGLVERSDREGWAVLVLDFPHDTTTSAGRFALTVLAGAAEMERRVIGERTKAALAIRKAQGIRLGRQLGEGRLLPAETLRLVLELGAGASLRQAAEELNARGVPAGRGGRWHAGTVRRALRQAAELSTAAA